MTILLRWYLLCPTTPSLEPRKEEGMRWGEWALEWAVIAWVFSLKNHSITTKLSNSWCIIIHCVNVLQWVVMTSFICIFYFLILLFKDLLILIYVHVCIYAHIMWVPEEATRGHQVHSPLRAECYGCWELNSHALPEDGVGQYRNSLQLQPLIQQCTITIDR